MRRVVPAAQLSPADLSQLPAQSVLFSAPPAGRSKCESNHQPVVPLPPASCHLKAWNGEPVAAGSLLSSKQAALPRELPRLPALALVVVERERALQSFFCFLFGSFRAGRLFSSLTLNFFRRGIGRPIDRANGTWPERSFSGDCLLARSRRFVRLFGGKLEQSTGLPVGRPPRRARSCGGFGSLCFRG